MALFDERSFTHPRYLVLLAAKPIGQQAHGRVWLHRDEVFQAGADGRIYTVTSIAGWLKTAGLLERGEPRARGGFYLVPTGNGFVKLDEKLRGAKV